MCGRAPLLDSICLLRSYISMFHEGLLFPKHSKRLRKFHRSVARLSFTRYRNGNAVLDNCDPSNDFQPEIIHRIIKEPNDQRHFPNLSVCFGTFGSNNCEWKQLLPCCLAQLAQATELYGGFSWLIDQIVGGIWVAIWELILLATDS